MPRLITTFLMTLSLFMMLAMRVSASQPVCMKAAELTAALARHHAEYPLATALGPTGYLVHIHVSAEGTWTLTVARPDGIACIAAAGHDFNLLHRDGLVPAQPT